MCNHIAKSQVSFSIIHKQMHLDKNKIYLHNHNFGYDTSKESQYDASSSKLRINVSKLFKEDADLDEQKRDLVSGKQFKKLELGYEKADSEDTCFRRFQRRYNEAIGVPVEEEVKDEECGH